MFICHIGSSPSYPYDKRPWERGWYWAALSYGSMLILLNVVVAVAASSFTLGINRGKCTHKCKWHFTPKISYTLFLKIS